MNTAPYRDLARKLLVDGSVNTRHEAHRGLIQLCSLLELSFLDRPQERLSLTKRQDQVWRYIAKHIRDTNIMPTHVEIKRDCGLSQNALVFDIINSLERRGYLVRLPGTKGAIEMLHWPEELQNG